MTRTYERPTREEGGPHDEYVERHPAYGMIGASRVSSEPGKTLFGSDFRHRHSMVVTIRRAQLARGLAHDWYHGREELVEVAMSEAQWAAFVSATNVGFGVPCTIEAIDNVPQPGITPTIDRTAQFRGEVEDLMASAIKSIDDIIAAGKVPKAVVQELQIIKQKIGSSVEYVGRQFDEHMEGTVEKAKSEIEAYIVQTIHSAGLESLAGKVPALELAEPEEKTDG